jgi:hypothetical protein
MKPLQSLVSTCVVLLTATVAIAASLDVQDLLTEGQVAMQRGDLAKAKAAFELVYKIDSRNTVAIGYLRQIKVAQANRPKGNDQEELLKGVIIPKIQFQEATLDAALVYLKKAVEKESGGKQVVNFVVQLPAEQVKTQSVTLNLTNVPATEALRYLGELVNATFVYEKYAIMLKPKSAAAAPAPAPVVAQ